MSMGMGVDQGGLPGIRAVVESVESEVVFLNDYPYKKAPIMLAAGTVDAGSTPTTSLRAGLVLGRVASTGYYTQWSPTATDGSQKAMAVLIDPINMLGTAGSATVKLWNALFSGMLKTSKLLVPSGAGVELARRQLSKRFVFDTPCFDGEFMDRPMNGTTLSSAYTIVAADNGTRFLTHTAAIDYTLPAIADGYIFEFRSIESFKTKVISAEGDNIHGFNDVDLDSISLETASQMIGTGLRFASARNAAGTLIWLVDLLGLGTADGTANPVTTVVD